MVDYSQQNRVNGLDAKLHLGHDPNAEFKEQGTLFSSVPYGNHHDKHTGVFGEIFQAIAGAVNQIFNNDVNDSNRTTFAAPQSNNVNVGLQDIAPGAGEANGDNSALLPSGGFGFSIQAEPAFNLQGTLLAPLDASSVGGGLPGPAPDSGGGGEDPQPPIPDPVPTPVPPIHVLTAPVINAPDAHGQENQQTPVTLQIVLDPDATMNTVFISGVPTGATLSAGTSDGHGTWTLTPTQLAGLTLTSAQYASGTYHLTITVVSSDGTDTVSASHPLLVDVEGVATPPNLSTQNANGQEDTAVALRIGAALVDTDGSETLSIIISNVPNGASFSAGINNGDGTWTLMPSQLVGLSFTPPLHSSGMYSLTVTAVSAENGTTATTSAGMNVTIAGVATTPGLTVQAATGNEDTAIPLSINAMLTDNDGSETLSIVIGGVPAGGTLSAGISDGHGNWTLTSAQLTGLTFTPPHDASGSYNFTVTATSSENGTTSSISAGLPVTVNGVADAPLLSVQAASGNEDNAIPLVINAALSDTDGSETLSVVISGVPNGGMLSAGTNNGNGSWTLTPAQLSNLTFTPPLHASGDFQLTVTAISSESGTTASSSATLAVDVTGTAHEPNLSVQAATGNEDTAIDLTISASLAVNDGSEVLSIVIGNVPNGATLSAGINNGDGTWTLTEAQLSGLTFTPPHNASGIYNLSVMAISNESGHVAVNTEALPVTVNGVADTPTLSVQAASGNENSAILLVINAALTDTDGSETMTVVISGVPTGGTLSAGVSDGHGNWTLTQAQLSNLTFTPPQGASGDYSFTVTATASENGTSASAATSMAVHVHGIAETPTLSVQAAVGFEDTNIPLVINAALLDLDGSEQLSIVIGNVPAGAVLSAGLAIGNGQWSLSASELVGLTIRPPENYSGTLNLQVTAIATEQDGDHASLSANCQVTVVPVADAPLLQVGPVSGVEDHFIPLNIQASLTDSSEILSVTVSGVPAGAILSAGVNNGNGTWTLIEAQLAGLSIRPPVNMSGDFVLNVTAISLESSGQTASTSGTLAVHVVGDADTPTISAGNVSGAVNTAVALNISGAVTDTDGSESITYLISGIPDGFALNHGSNNGDNTWTVTQAQLSGLALVSPYNFEGRLHLTAQAVSHEIDGSVAVSPPADFIANVGLHLGLEINLALGIGVGIGGVDLGTHAGVGVGIGANLGGLLAPDGIVLMEDTSLQLTDAPGLLGSLTAFALGLLADIKVSGLTTGATLSNGTYLGNGVYQLTPAQLSNLYLISAPNSDQDFTMTFTAEFLGGLLPLTLNQTVVHAVGVADVPSVSVASIIGNEDASGIAVNIAASLVSDLDGSEALSIVIHDLQPGFTLNHGINNADGSWTLTPAQLSGLEIIPPKDFSGDATYTVTAVSTEREGDSSATSVTGHIHVNPVADAPVVSVGVMHGAEDQPMALNVAVGLQDTDGSEHIASITVSGLPNGFSLSNATDNHDGTWSINPANLTNVQLTPPSNWHGDATFSLTVASQENSGGPLATTHATVPIHIDARADIPNADAHDVAGHAGQAVALDLSAGLNDTDGSEHLSIVIGGMSNGLTLSAGHNNGDGTWTLSESQLTNVALMLPANANANADVHLTMTAYATEASNGDIAHSTPHDFTVHVG